MKKLFFIILSLGLINGLYAQNNYFTAFITFQKAKRSLSDNPQKAEILFAQTYNILRNIVNRSIEKNRPSTNSIKLLGELYLHGWGVPQNKKKAFKFLCAAKEFGNIRAKNELKNLHYICKKITLKELKQ